MKFDRFCTIVERESRKVPERLFVRLDGGVHCERPLRTDPDDRQIVQLGHYEPGFPSGARVVLHHGSFEATEFESERAYRLEIRRTLRHELRHHWEDSAGIPDLHDLDTAWLYRNRRMDRDPEADLWRGDALRTVSLFVVGAIAVLPPLIFPDRWLPAAVAGLFASGLAYRALVPGERRKRKRGPRRKGPRRPTGC